MSFLRAETLSIHGPDAIAFANAQLASNVGQLETGLWQWSAWLNPQGRVSAIFQILRTSEQHLVLLLRGGTAADIASELDRYVLRSKVTIAALEPCQLLDADPCPEYHLQTEGDDLVLGMGHYAMRITTIAGTSQHWRLSAIEAGHPWLPDSALGTILAPALSLQQLAAVSLDKGCYPGQEIVARLHYRGGNKQHLCQVEGIARLPPGNILTCQGESVGQILDSVTDADGASRALAVIRDIGGQAKIHADTANGAIKIIRINKL